jgi:adenine-specific DNA-methyltransferase
MSTTIYHAKYMAYELSRRFPSDSAEKLTSALVDAQVDLNPHQIDAALFAFKSPLSKGALLADEVGLGKTIEAGLILSQRWAERKRRILIIVPANLRKQWFQELTEKFFLPCEILESRSYNSAVDQGVSNPFETNKLVICSYHFARSKAEAIRAVPWNLVVIDEAHRLRNVYKPSNVIANALKEALAGRDKLLLTATPLQNSLLELYGLVSFIDEQAFGDVESFREQFVNMGARQNFTALKERLGRICHRTLRRQVLPYVKYTQRFPLVERFTPSVDEEKLYALVSAYLQRENLEGLPRGQRTLIVLVMRKLLASSTFAIAGALRTIGGRLARIVATGETELRLDEELRADFEALDETQDEANDNGDNGDVPPPVIDRARIQQEISDLESFALLAESITVNAKGIALVQALDVAFAKAVELGAAKKAIIFTESRRTQNYLLETLTNSRHAEGIVLFNGSNGDTRSRQIYAAWVERHKGTDRVTGSRTADMRSALVDYFRDEGRIMIATEAAAEGINLQFCSLVVNYDLPWNPQRVEQRIGRCHRYGQKHDVVVVNFLNRNNEADERVYQLLSEKFQLFRGVFGASDEVLGAIESGVDFEKRIADIYQQCRRSEEIQAAFDRLQSELSEEITESLAKTREQLLEHFDDEVREKLRIRDEASKAYLDRFEKMLIELTRFELGDDADFGDDSSFRLLTNRLPGCESEFPTGLYELPRRSGEAHFYRMSHPLAQELIRRARERVLAPAHLRLDIGLHQGKISALEPYARTSGWLQASLYTVDSFDQAEDHMILTAVTENGETLEPELARRLFDIPSEVVEEGIAVDMAALDRIGTAVEERRNGVDAVISARNGKYFEDEAIKLDDWADDLKVGLEREIKNLDKQIRETRRVATGAVGLEAKLKGQKAVRALENERSRKRKSLFEAQDDIDRRRDELIKTIEHRLKQKAAFEELFTIRWSLR